MTSYGGVESSHLLNRREVSWRGGVLMVGIGVHSSAIGPRYKCGRNVVLYTSKTSKKPNKPFYGCPYYKEKKRYCAYFLCLDECTDDQVVLSMSLTWKRAELSTWRGILMRCKSI